MALNRRQFLQRSTLAATVLAAPTLRSAPNPPGARLKIGFLGVAHSHAAGKIKAVQNSSAWELIGVHAETETLRETYRRAGVPLLAPDELLRRAEVVAVQGAVRDHYRMAKQALEAGQHVHLEKPPTATLAEFRELLALAKKHQRLLQMGYMWRYHPGLRAISQAVREGWLGEVHEIRASMNSSIPPATRAELAEFPGGGMFELGCHLIDVVVRMMGRPKNVTAVLKNQGASGDQLADNTVAVLEFPRALAIVNINLMEPGAGAHRFLEVSGTNGRAILRPIEPPVLQFHLARPAGPHAAKAQTVSLPKYERYVPEMEDLADAVRRSRPLEVTPETDLLVHEALLQACGVRK